MANKSVEEIQKIIKVCSVLGWSQEDIIKVFGITKKDIQNLVKYCNI